MAATATTTTAAFSFLTSLLFSLNESALYQHHPIMLFFSLLFLFAFSLLSLAFLFYFLFNGLHLQKTGQKTQTQTRTQPDQSVFTFSSSKTSEKTHESNPTHSLLLEFVPSNSAKWGSLFQSSGCGTDPVTDGSGLNVDLDRDLGVENRVNKKKKKRAKKKKLNSKEENGVVEEKGGEAVDELGLKESQELVCMFPFTTSSSVIQRKIKQQFDQLVKCHESKQLTLAQVGQFANCLIEVKQELEHKSEVIQRKFTITKALLYKADRSSFDRLCQQIHKLEMEQKRLEEDAFVYNLLQQQLKLSPAYKKILEISARLELKANSEELMESADDTEFSEMSFEELLAREKMDSFWQKNRKSKSCST